LTACGRGLTAAAAAATADDEDNEVTLCCRQTDRAVEFERHCTAVVVTAFLQTR